VTQALTDLVKLLSLHAEDEGVFVGNSQDLGFKQLFGGQVLGQCVSAASQMINFEKSIHSIHGYFLRPGDSQLQVEYQVNIVRESRNFIAVQVTAVQSDCAIFVCYASFQNKEEGFHHQIDMPDVLPPDQLKNEVELAGEAIHLLPEAIKLSVLSQKPLDIRPVSARNPLLTEKRDPIQCIWFRANGYVPKQDFLQQSLLGYASDFNLLTTSMLPHSVSIWQPTMQVASLDHALWFHEKIDLNDWLLYSIESPWSGKGRGFSRANIFNRQGVLVASVAQEGLIRKRRS
ncbi:UNVERIFIED_CONTAM: hypothetical protein GTU68_056372, partial [Idotea baltica]|nr:hypothetical protein [Idotea baltica]